MPDCHDPVRATFTVYLRCPRCRRPLTLCYRYLPDTWEAQVCRCPYTECRVESGFHLDGEVLNVWREHSRHHPDLVED